jgi:hypothetical protein
LQQPFFFLGRPAHLRLLGRRKRTDLLIEGNEFLAEYLEAMKLTDLQIARQGAAARWGKEKGTKP